VFLGYDKPRSLGATAQAAHYAAPVFRDFMQMALKDKPATPFRIPPGIKLIRITAATGTRAGSGDNAGVILEAFKPGTAPPDGFAAAGPAQVGMTPDGERAVGAGSGGLY
jgi:penicillin-binding protein 1A